MFFKQIIVLNFALRNLKLKTMKNFFSSLPLFLLIALSCSKTISPTSAGVDSEQAHGMIVLGEKLSDPYSLENMTKAYQSLYPTKADRVPISETHLYVRFLPKSDSELELLSSKVDNLLDHPVDYQILREGDYYMDPSLPQGSITWQYAVVDKDFDFPEGIAYELLHKCYLPSDSPASKAEGLDWESLEREAYRLSGNLDLLQETKADSDEAVPKGRITITDSSLGGKTEGVRGVKVSCNTFVKFDSAFTDDNGYYSMKRSFTSSPRYRLVFKNRYGFALGFNLILVQASASSLGKQSAEGYTLCVSETSERKLFTRCVVNNAGFDYYSMCKTEKGSMKTPPQNLRLWLFQFLDKSSAVMMHQGAIVDSGKLAKLLGEYAGIVKIFLPDITLGLKGCEDYASIYALACHEFAHASHYMAVGNSFWDKYAEYIVSSFVSSGFIMYGSGTDEDCGYCEVGEMWAYYMQGSMYKDRYGDKVNFGTEYWFSPQIFTYLEEKGMDRYKIFDSLSSDVIDRTTLKKRMTSLYPQFKTSINQAFSKYN